jgi:hypothetical protein
MTDTIHAAFLVDPLAVRLHNLHVGCDQPDDYRFTSMCERWAGHMSDAASIKSAGGTGALALHRDSLARTIWALDPDPHKEAATSLHWRNDADAFMREYDRQLNRR